MGMAALELRGAPVAAAITARLAPAIAGLKSRGVVPCLGVVRIGEREDDLSYERGLKKRFEANGAAIRTAVLPEACAQAQLEEAISSLNGDPAVHGILLFRPLSKGLDSPSAEELVAPLKDVDGMTSANCGNLFLGRPGAFAPCTAQAVMELLAYYEIPLQGRRVTIVGRSAVVGKPLALLMLAANATPTLCHTKTADLAGECRRGEIVVACAGSAGMITPDMVSESAILVDVGINVENGRLVGDISGAAWEKAAAFTPVPGGVGAVTNAVLLSHVVESALRA